MYRIQKLLCMVVVLFLSFSVCAGVAVCDDESPSADTRTINVGGRTFEVPASRISADNIPSFSSSFQDALADMKSRFAEQVPLSVIGARINNDTAVTPGSISQAVNIANRTQRIPVVGSAADIANPVAGQRIITGGKLMEYRAAEGTQPAGWVNITSQGAAVGNVVVSVTTGNSTAPVPVVTSRPAGAPAEGEPTKVVYRNMVYEWQAGSEDHPGYWKNVTYNVVPAASVEANSHEQAILVNGEQAQALIVTQVPAAEGSEYIVMGSQVYRWDDAGNKYVAVTTGTGEDEHPKIIDGAVTATVHLSGGAEVTDVPVYSQVPAVTGAHNGDACVVVNPTNGRELVYIFDSESNAWERSTASYSLSATVDRASAVADVTIDGVLHEDVKVVAHLPEEHTQGQDIIVVRSPFFGREKVYVWNAQTNSWDRVAQAAELGKIYQQFAVMLPGGEFTASAQVVGSVDEISRPRQGQVVAVTDASGNADKLYRYDNGEWKLIKEL